MAKHTSRRATTLSISLPRELAQAVEQRVENGLYTSASELIREALRLLLEIDGARPAAVGLSSPVARRLTTAFDLAETGTAIRSERLRRTASEVAEPKPAAGHGLVARALHGTDSEQQEIGPGLRDAPERLARLRIDG